MINKSRVAVSALFVMALCVIGLYAATAAANAVPGSEGDPVVTKSYVDQRIGDVMRVMNNSESGVALPGVNSDELMAQIEYAVKNYVQKAEGSSFAPISIEMGDTIYAGEGCEIILRTGIGFIVTNTDAVVNATTGIDLKNGASVPKGNLLIFPRDDGRGIKASDKCWFLVKGAYRIDRAPGGY